MSVASFQLKVQKIDQTCLFELSWGKGQQLCCTLYYLESLAISYQEWQRTYLSFYKSEFRGWLEDSGSISPPPIDWHAKLVQAEAKLLYEFHNWLRSGELYDIRATIAKSQLFATQDKQRVDLFIVCDSIELARLPWEAWEIGAEFPNNGCIRIVRMPQNIDERCNQEQIIPRRSKARILAILGDDTGLNFQHDRLALLRCSHVAEIEFIGWQPGLSIDELKTKICQSLVDERGWDVLLFAGHSNETDLTGGQLAIAPNISISISEIKQQLLIAKAHGLKFALFNSCCGIKIAEDLIKLGLCQVVVMREPIHNVVAQTFLLKFLQVLAAHQDVGEATLAACQYLKLENNLTYPSAWLIPSLFCHPDAVLFQIPPSGWQHQLKSILPTKLEAIALVTLGFLSLFHPVQNLLLEQRIFAQAVYRQFTQQIPSQNIPPVLLVQIDEASIKIAKIPQPKPMSRQYLAKLVDKLAALDAKVVGLDYLLDRHQGKSDRILSNALKSATQKQTRFVLASVHDYNSGWLTALPEIANNSSMQGHINLVHWYVEQIHPNVPDFQVPFSYQLALAYKINIATNLNAFQRERDSSDFSQIKQEIRDNKGDGTALMPERSQFHPLTSFAYDWGQMWGQPILDFSIPPNQIYQSIPAWQLLKISPNSSQLNHLQQQIVIIAPGGYGEAGVFKVGQDNYPLPKATKYWLKSTGQNHHRDFTGGEAHAYMVHHFIKSWLVIPVPDFWMVLLAILLGKITKTFRTKYHPKGWLFLLGGTAIYGVIGLQIYVAAAYLLPWFLPSAMYWTYILPAFLGKKEYG